MTTTTLQLAPWVRQMAIEPVTRSVGWIGATGGFFFLALLTGSETLGFVKNLTHYPGLSWLPWWLTMPAFAVLNAAALWSIVALLMLKDQFVFATFSLVPHLRRRLQRLAMACMLVICSSFALFLFVTAPKVIDRTHTWFWFALLMTSMVGAIRTRWLILPFLASTYIRPVSPKWFDQQLTLLPHLQTWLPPVGVIALGLGLLAATAHWVFAQRGDAHLGRCYKAVRTLLQGSDPNASSFTHVKTSFAWFYSHLLAWHTRQPASAARARRLTPWVMGGSFHWATTVTQAVLVALVCTLVWAGLHFVIPNNTQGDIYGVSPIFVLMVLALVLLLPVIKASAPHTLIPVTRREQALVGLTELAPRWANQTPVYFRYFVTQYLWHCVLAWGLGLAIIGVSAVPYITPWVLATAIACQWPICTVMLSNYAGARVEDIFPFRTLGYVVVSALLMVYCGLLHFSVGVRAPWLFGALTAVSAVLAVWQWKRHVGHAAMFPAGRAV